MEVGRQGLETAKVAVERMAREGFARRRGALDLTLGTGGDGGQTSPAEVDLKTDTSRHAGAIRAVAGSSANAPLAAWSSRRAQRQRARQSIHISKTAPSGPGV